ncbi:MAG: TIGR03757 family integrating conjugative element protein [Gammaproteobacteria bacterium]
MNPSRAMQLLLAWTEALLAAEAPRIEIFTTARYPISGATPAVQIYILDEPARIEAELSGGLPQGKNAAAEFARAQVQGAWREPAQHLTRAYQGLLKARQYGVLRLPAIVFDGQVVVYGITDLEQALAEYRRLKAGSP